MAEQKYEYKTESLDDYNTSEETKEGVANWGKDGWRYVETIGGAFCIFERYIPQPKQEKEDGKVKLIESIRRYYWFDHCGDITKTFDCEIDVKPPSDVKWKYYRDVFTIERRGQFSSSFGNRITNIG